MRKLVTTLSLFAVIAAVSCVTVNIYFPAEEVRSAADKIVSEVYGEQKEEKPAEEKSPGPGTFWYQFLEPRSAYAQQDIDISTPEIRAIREAMKRRSSDLRPYMNSGHVAIGNDGLLGVRTHEGLGLKERAEVNRLVSEENADRKRLYEEIAQANGFPEKVDEVQTIFSRTWREKAQAGWYLEQSDGSWQKK